MTENRELYVVEPSTAGRAQAAFATLDEIATYTINTMREMADKITQLQMALALVQNELALMEAERDRWRDEARRLAEQLKGERE